MIGRRAKKKSEGKRVEVESGRNEIKSNKKFECGVRLAYLGE